MDLIDTARRTVAWMWLPPAVSAATGCWVYQHAYEEELGSRAGAEPTMAGLLKSFPFLVLLLVQLICVLLAWASESRVGRSRALWSASVAVAAVILLVLRYLVLGPQDTFTDERGALAGLLVAALALPLIPAWVSHARTRAA